ncbi:dehydrogenase [Streptomyces sp. NPDC001691]|uniref:dehydrogenase n=1 Tax=Streptomyces sp. NPDC001691 TaxID=3364600 RepID=UPI00367FFB70
MIDENPACPECGRTTTFGGLVLFKREEDGLRVCRALSKCPGRHVWWRWADRPDEPLEACPTPEVFR